MICKNCNIEIPENTTTCPKCGTTFPTVEEATVAPRGFSAKKNIVIILLAALLVLGVGTAITAFAVTHSASYRVSHGLTLAERYLNEQNYQQAVIEFLNILEIEPKNVDAYLGLADAYIALGDTDKAIEILQEGLDKTGDARIQAKLDELLKPQNTEPKPDPEPPVSSSTTTSSSTTSSSVSSSSSTSSTTASSSTTSSESSSTSSSASTTSSSSSTTTSSSSTASSSSSTTTTTSSSSSEPVVAEPEPEPAGTVLPEIAALNVETTKQLIIFNREEYKNSNVTNSMYDQPENYPAYTYIVISKPLSAADLEAISKLTNLSYLIIGFAGLSDITPLASLTNLNNLSLSQNEISDISPLTNLTGLSYLALDNNNISDITALSNLTKLRYLYLHSNPITDLRPVANLTDLTNLGIANCKQISDAAPLANLTKLYSLQIQGTSISDITPLAKLTNLRSLSLSSTQVSASDKEWLRSQLPDCNIP